MRLLITWILLFIVSCNKTTSNKELVEYKNGRQLLNLNHKTISGDKLESPEIGLFAVDSVLVGEEYFAKIFLKDKDYRLIAAYVGCKEIDNATVDTIVATENHYKRLDGGCENELFVENDTIQIYFRPETPGLGNFSDITILTQDKNKIFRTQKYSFNFKVYGR